MTLPASPAFAVGTLTHTQLNVLRTWGTEPLGIFGLRVGTYRADSPDEKLLITAKFAKLTSGSATYVVGQDISLAPDITASGANGLDAGSVAANTDYYIWLIAKDAGVVAGGDANQLASNTAGLISTSATSPTLPAGYTHKRRISWCRTDATGDIFWFQQDNEDYKYEWTRPDMSGVGLASYSAAQARTAISLTGYVPTVAKSVRVFIQNTVVTGDPLFTVYVKDTTERCLQAAGVTTSVCVDTGLVPIVLDGGVPKIETAYAGTDFTSVTGNLYCRGFIFPVDIEV